MNKIIPLDWAELLLNAKRERTRFFVSLFLAFKWQSSGGSWKYYKLLRAVPTLQKERKLFTFHAIVRQFRPRNFNCPLFFIEPLSCFCGSKEIIILFIPLLCPPLKIPLLTWQGEREENPFSSRFCFFSISRTHSAATVWIPCRAFLFPLIRFWRSFFLTHP